MNLKLQLVSTKWLMIGLLLSYTHITATASRIDDSLALVTLNEALIFSWDLSEPMTTWQGVSLNTEGRVNQLSASPTGGILTEAIGELTELTVLDMSEADLAGRIPASIINLTQLTHLNLNENNLEGPIPNGIGNLSNLQYLDLSDNQLEGEIPASIWQLTNLTYLSIGGGGTLTGTLDGQIGKLKNLERLTITDTRLSGSIPPEIGQMPALKYLYLESNYLSGSIPLEIGNLINLEQLLLGQNELSGSIPVEIENLTNLQSLYLNGNELSGTIPDFSDMPNLQTLAVGDNHFTFAGMEDNLNILNFYYAPQAHIPLALANTTLSVEAGNTGAFGSNAYEWYKNGVLQTVITDTNTFQPTETGYYHCEIRNTPITKPSVFGRDLTLITKSVFFNQFDGLVFPGDLNRDGVANNVDVLYWGLVYGDTGPERPEANTLWEPQPAPDWATEVAGINGKHQDGDGDGTIAVDDLDAILTNYGETYPSEPKLYQSLPVKLSAHFNQLETYTDSIAVTFDIHLEGADAIPATAHGIGFTIIYNEIVADGIDHLYALPDATDSWLDTSVGNMHAIHKNTENTGQTDIALTRDNGQDALGMGNICTVRMVFRKNADMPDELTILLQDITLLNAAGEEYVVNDNQLTIFGLQNIEQSTGLAFAVNSYNTSCDENGKAEVVIIQDGTMPYQYAWSNGATTATVADLDPDLYRVTITDADDISTEGYAEVNGNSPISIVPSITHTVNGFENGNINLAILGGDGNYNIQWNNGQTGTEVSNLGIGELIVEISDGTGCLETFKLFVGQEAVPAQMQVFLQGAYDSNTGLMNDALRDQGLLPLTDPYIATFKVDPAVLDISGNDAIVDWLLLELRDDADPSILQKQQAIFVQRDGDIVGLDGVSPPKIEGIRHGLYHLVIKHRNHIPIMSENPFLLTKAGLIYNFTLQDSYTGVAGFGQLPLDGGVWAMFGGDADQSHEITGPDKSIWAPLNGTFSRYLTADYNLDGDVNGSDKGIWFNNNGISSRVPQANE